MNVEAHMLRPVGCIIKLFVGANPASLLGFGTWQRVSRGRIDISMSESDPDLNNPGGTGGSKTHALAVGEMGIHNHPASGSANSHSHAAGSLTASSLGIHNHSYTNVFGSNITIQSGSNNRTMGPGSTIEGTVDGAHTHTVSGSTDTASQRNNVITSSTGGGQPHNNMPPYITVFIWKRSA